MVAESDGTSGLERAKVYDADLIISDVLMPGCSGFELTRKLKNDFNSLRNMFDELKREIDKNVVKEENYKGEFYEIAPYSYQRNRFKQGKIVGNVTSLKTTNNLFTYYFDAKNQIIEIREGLELKNQFYYTFFIYEKELMDTLQHSFDYKPNGELKFIILSTELYSETIYQET